MKNKLDWRELQELRVKRKQARRIMELERRVTLLEDQLTNPKTAQRAAEIVQQVIAGHLRKERRNL